MRIHSISPRWPILVAAAACLSRVVLAATTTSEDDGGDSGGTQNVHPSIITFDDSSFKGEDGSDAAVYSVVGQMASVNRRFVFNFTAGSFVQVSDIWLVGKSEGDIGHASPNNTQMLPTETMVNGGIGGVKATSPRSTDFPMTLSVYDTYGVVYLPDLTLIDTATYGGYDTSLYFRVGWNGTGKSYSRDFTVTNQEYGTAPFKVLQEKFTSPDPASPEELPGSTTDTQSTVAASGPTSTGTTGTATASATSTGMADNGKGGGGGGLSTGAIAGIAVACGVIGLALLGFAIWFFCFRRRRGDGVSAAPYGNDRHHRTQELIAEKEANAGVTESPHSPYSDDGGQQQHHQAVGMNGSIPMDQAANARDSAQFVGTAAPIMAASPHPHSIDRSYTPYSDHRGSGIIGTPETQQSQPVQHYDQSERAAAPSPQVASQPTTAAATARSVSPQQGPGGRYAHLVEEGMTEDEIRRLEEEERQLDAAIADREAGRGR